MKDVGLRYLFLSLCVGLFVMAIGDIIGTQRTGNRIAALEKRVADLEARK